MKEVVYCSAIGNGDEAEWDFGWERYKNSKVASEKELLLNALSCTKKTWLLIRYMQYLRTFPFYLYTLIISLFL